MQARVHTGTWVAVLLALASGGFAVATAASQATPATATPAPAYAPAEAQGPLGAASGGVRALAPDARHRYTTSLAPGMLLALDVAQLGIDVVIESRAAGAETGVVVDDVMEHEGEERVRFIAPAAGDYEVEVRSEPLPGVTAGRYRLDVLPARPATDDDRATDRRRTGAEADLAAIEKAIGNGVVQAPDARVLYDRLESVVNVFTAERMHRRRAAAMRLQSVMLVRQLRFDLVRTFNERRLPWLVGARYRADRAYALNHLAEGLLRTGEMARAIEAFGEASTLPQSALNSAIVKDNLGAALRRVGRYQEALAAHDEALAFFTATKATRSVGIVLNRIALVWEAVGDYRQALDAGARALAAFTEARDSPEVARVNLNAGGWHIALGDTVAARTALTAGLALAETSGQATLVAQALDYLALVEELEGHAAEASRLAERARVMYVASGNAQGEATASLLIGRLHHQAGRFDDAHASLVRALDLGRRIDEVEVQVSVLRALAGVESARGRVADARARLDEAVALVEDGRRNLGGPVLRTSFMSRRQQVYGDLVDVLQTMHAEAPEAGHAATAFRVTEGGRARSLLDALLQPGVDLSAGVDPALLGRSREARQRLNDRHALQRAAQAQNNTADATRLGEEIERLTGEVALADGAIRAAHPQFSALTSPEPLGPADVQRDVLDDQTVLLEFAIGPARSWVWAITTTDVATFELPGRAVFEPLARAVLTHTADAAAARRVDGPLRQTITELSRHLLTPVAGRLDGEWRGKRLVIVASDVLAYVPFAALTAPGGERPLIAGHEIVYAPSATAMATMRREVAGRAQPAKTLAILADPVFDAADPRVARANAPRPSSSGAASTPAPPASPLRPRSLLPGTRGSLARLPSSRREATNIAALLPQAEVLLATDFAANREWVTSPALAKYRIVHFATHGIIDTGNPALTSLALSSVDAQGTERDGLLRMHELYDMRLPADLVVLSACQTALGREMAGEGLVGLTRGFMYAGARRVVATLWQVDDAATAAFMTRFYRHMLQGRQSASAALRAAQQEMAAQPQYASPYYWAGFVLHGEWR
ncbi:MAG: CHAT domain-containing protein [Acidobacteria bacterium]|nr:CHAT domain-containing protein [Acidobacteriota bacterium]